MSHLTKIKLKLTFFVQLGQGVLIKVQSSLIKRSKNHFHNLTVGISIILGNNGYIWIEPTSNDNKDLVGLEDEFEQVIIVIFPLVTFEVFYKKNEYT
jgi:exosome complex RNA-binding protein Rrp4